MACTGGLYYFGSCPSEYQCLSSIACSTNSSMRQRLFMAKDKCGPYADGSVTFCLTSAAWNDGCC